ncbi:MAG TPA: hypothetical protein VF872_00975, partial [Gaiellaceae bacterium]
AGELARLAVERVEGDLGSVHVESGYDRHLGPPLSSLFQLPREESRAEPREALLHAIFLALDCDPSRCGELRVGSKGFVKSAAGLRGVWYDCAP